MCIRDRIKRENNMTMDDFFEKSGMSKEGYDTELETAARNIVKRALVLEAVAEANDIEWTDVYKRQVICSMVLNSRSSIISWFATRAFTQIGCVATVMAKTCPIRKV